MTDSPYTARAPTDKDKDEDEESSLYLYTCEPPASASTSHPFLPPCKYRITLPSGPIGPGASFPVSLALQLPPSSSSSSSNPQIALYSLSVVLERRMVFYEASVAESAPEPLSGTAPSTPKPSPAASRSTASSATASTTPVPTPAHTPSCGSTLNATGISLGRKRRASASPTTLPYKSCITTIVTTETTLASGGSGPARTAQLTIELPVPPRPPLSQWPIGETTRTDLATIAFYVRVKVGVVVQPQSSHATHCPPTSSSSSASASSSGAAPTVYEYELPEWEVQMASVTEEEREVALARIAEWRSRSRRVGARAPNKLTSTGDPVPSSDVRPLPKGASTIKSKLDDAPKGGVSAAMLNSRLKSVKASRASAASAAASGFVASSVVVNSSDSRTGSSGPCPSTGSSASALLSVGSYGFYPNTPNEPIPTRSKTPRPQTVNISTRRITPTRDSDEGERDTMTTK